MGQRITTGYGPGITNTRPKTGPLPFLDMSLCWRMNRADKPVYMEDGKVVSLYVVALEREGKKMATFPKKADEELWYLRIVKNFVLPRDEESAAQPPPGAGKYAFLFLCCGAVRLRVR
ncbi:hypothetical protein Hdeb2414_s0006g00203961 [Helianthus debilis subsp. tardiflorus]